MKLEAIVQMRTSLKSPENSVEMYENSKETEEC